MDPAKNKLLLSLLEELEKSIEELLLAGLTTASKSTVERLDISFKEASRIGLLRLGSTLRVVNEEIVRFNSGSAQFSPKRLAFFVGRAWVLATAMRKAMLAGDDAEMERLNSSGITDKVDRLKVVVMGVGKRVVPGVFAGFDFRLRVLEGSGKVKSGESLTWSAIFPMRKESKADLPAEAFLHLPQKQKFKPSLLLEKKMVEVTHCAISRQGVGPARLQLTENSVVTAGEPFQEWQKFWQWDVRQAAERLQTYQVTPLDLEVELQEELCANQWEPGPRQSVEDGYDLLSLRTEHVPLNARLDRGPSGTPLVGVIEKMAAKKVRPPLYGLAHYEACMVVFQPLSALEKNGIEYLTISADKVSQAELVKAMKFT